MTALNAFLHLFRLWIPVRCAGKYKRLSPTATGYFILSPFPPHYTILEKPLIDFYLVFGKPVSSQIPFRIIYYNEITFIISYALSQEDWFIFHAAPKKFLRCQLYISRFDRHCGRCLHFFFFWAVPQPARPKAKTSTIPANNILIGFIRIPSFCWEIPTP